MTLTADKTGWVSTPPAWKPVTFGSVGDGRSTGVRCAAVQTMPQPAVWCDPATVVSVLLPSCSTTHTYSRRPGVGCTGRCGSRVHSCCVTAQAVTGRDPHFIRLHAMLFPPAFPYPGWQLVGGCDTGSSIVMHCADASSAVGCLSRTRHVKVDTACVQWRPPEVEQPLWVRQQRPQLLQQAYPVPGP